MDWFFIITSLLKITILLGVILFMVSYAVYAERRVSAFIQDRLGPNRVGPAGLLQPIADMLSYELSLGLAVIPVFLLVGNLRLTSVVRYQIEHGWFIAAFVGDWMNPWKWLLAIPMIISFLVFMIAIFAETNRLPFDLP